MASGVLAATVMPRVRLHSRVIVLRIKHAYQRLPGKATRCDLALPTACAIPPSTSTIVQSDSAAGGGDTLRRHLRWLPL